MLTRMTMKMPFFLMASRARGTPVMAAKGHPEENEVRAELSTIIVIDTGPLTSTTHLSPQLNSIQTTSGEAHLISLN